MPLRNDEVDTAQASSFVMTGPELIERVARSIQLNQSVLLEGPRGCGKTFCVLKGIELAAQRGYIPMKADVFVQGNREIPRDYLAEDDIAFRLLNADSDVPTVRPYRRSAPLFRFAKRDPKDGEPLKRGERDDRVICQTENEEPMDRFVLFLDEINRFSDGVLDSLLSLLEERVAVLGGRKFVLPVTVCMTMNPPGYDSSARKLSPPLAARIGRSYRLSTPDLDTLTDFVVSERWEQTRAEYNSESEAAKTRNTALIAALKENLEVASGEQQKEFLQSQIRQAEREGKVYQSPFPDEEPLLIRKAALVTLCLWGDVNSEKRQPGLEYLTRGTHELLIELMRRDRQIGDAMRKLTDLCHYGPDGRAVADWMVSATAKAVQDASLARRNAKLKPEHLIDTVLDTICHKIYDKFSPATEPHKTQLKEQIVDKIARRILMRGSFDDLLSRNIDDPNFVWECIGRHLITLNDKKELNDRCAAVRKAFTKSRVTSNDELGAWIGVINEALESGPGTKIEEILYRKRRIGNEQIEILIERDPFEDGEKAGFSNPRFYQLVRTLARLENLQGVGIQLCQVLEIVGPVRRSLSGELADRPVVKQITVKAFLDACSPIDQRTMLLTIADELEELSGLDIVQKWESKTDGGEKGGTNRDFDAFLNDISVKSRERMLRNLSVSEGTGVEGESANPGRKLCEAMGKLLRLVADQTYRSGTTGSDDTAEFLEGLAEQFVR